MLRTVNALARALGFVWLGLLAFLIAPPSAPYAAPVQIACYAVLGLALLAWTVLEASPAATGRYPAWALPLGRGVIAFASGFAAGAGGVVLVLPGRRDRPRHPVVVLGDQLYLNPYYEPPELVLSDERPASAAFSPRSAARGWRNACWAGSPSALSPTP